MPYDASNGSGAAGLDGHGRHQDHPCHRGHQDHLGAGHPRLARTGVGMTRRLVAKACSQDGYREHLLDAHREHRDEHLRRHRQDRLGGHLDHLDARLEHPEVLDDHQGEAGLADR
jgi:hypothetical protein